MDSILELYLWKFVVVYLDDIVVFSQTPQEHEEHLQLVWKAIADAGLVLNGAKCNYMKREIEVLGHQVARMEFVPSSRG
ncbi:hypothetical protein PAPHI01_2593 [Pancytospora philotis]|nr:hypothetical protein PAPHI01_2593 [Pancytospora philotis]